MIADLGHDVSACTVSEDGISFALLVDAMYASEVPLTTDCIDVLSGKWNVLHTFICCVATMQTVIDASCKMMNPINIQIIVCTLQRPSCSMKRLHDSCSRFISKIPLDIDNLAAAMAYPGQQIRLQGSIGALRHVCRKWTL